MTKLRPADGNERELRLTLEMTSGAIWVRDLRDDPVAVLNRVDAAVRYLRRKASERAARVPSRALWFWCGFFACVLFHAVTK